MHDIKIHDVSFSYAGSDKLVLKDINVDVEGGEFEGRTWTHYDKDTTVRG